MNDYIAFLTGWAADIRASSGENSADADCLESIASALQNLVAENAYKAAEIARLKSDLDRSHRREAGWSDDDEASLEEWEGHRRHRIAERSGGRAE